MFRTRYEYIPIPVPFAVVLRSADLPQVEGGGLSTSQSYLAQDQSTQ